MKRRASGTPSSSSSPPKKKRYALSPPPPRQDWGAPAEYARKPVVSLPGAADLRLGSPGALRRVAAPGKKRPAPPARDGAAYVEARFPGSRLLGKGAYGAVYLVDAERHAAALADLAARAGRVRGGAGGLPRRGDLVLKVALKDSGTSWESFVRDNMHESQVHARLGERRCVRVACAGGAGSTGVCAADVVPELYFAGPDDAAGVFVAGMSRVAGQTLDAYLRAHGDRLSAETYVAIEKAVVTLWLLGVAHGDLHAGNLLLDDAGRVTIIDFGFGVVLPPDQLARVQRVLDAAPNATRSLANAVWYVKGALQNYVNSVLRGRDDFSWYNPDGKLLRAMYNRVRDPARIAAARAAAWRCPVSRLSTPALPSTPSASATARRRPRRASPVESTPGLTGMTSLFVSPVVTRARARAAATASPRKN